MISNNEILSKGLETYRDTIVRQKTWGKYKVISSDADTKHGYNSHCVIIDELHAFKNRDLYDVLMTSTGARRQPLVLIITTAGFDRKSICYQIYNYAKKVRDGQVKDDSFLPVIFEASESDDPFSPKTWAKANPGYDVTIKKEYLETEANKALVNPSDLNVFKRLHLNIWTKSETVWIPSHTWNGDKSKQIKRELEYYKDRQCFIGIDLANYADLLPVCMVFPNEDGTFDVLIEYWVTEDKANDRKSKNEADYLTWAGQGYVHLTPGNVADYQTIRKRIGEIAQVVKIQVIGYDDWNASQFAQDLGSDGANINPWSPNNFKLWHKPSQTLEALATAGKINHMNNPVLAWNVENVVIRYNGEYIKPDKSKSKDKIDGVIALIIAIGEWMNYIDQPAPTNGGIGL